MAVAGDVALLALTSLWLMLPAYLANIFPVFVGGGMPIDFRRDWKDGHRILGDGKTWRGLLFAPVLSAALVGVLQWLADNTAWGNEYGFPGWGAWPAWFVFAYLMGLGALTGDAVESFFKRRTGRVRGERWIPFDQLDFVVGGLLFAYLAGFLLVLTGTTPTNLALELFTWPRVLAILVLTPGLHLLVNWIGYKLGLKDVPW